MKNAAILSLVPCLAVAVSACGGGGNNTPPGPVACTGDGVTIKAADANNYAFTSTLTIPPIKVASKTELNFDWGAVTKDFLGHTMDPKVDVASIVLLSWNLPLKDLETNLNADTLLQRDLTVAPLSLTTDGTTPNVAKGATSAKLFDFTLNGGAISNDGGSVTIDQALGYFDASFYPASTTTYTVMVSSSITPGQGVRMIQSFQVDASSSNVDVKVTPSSTQLTYNANLHSLTPTGLPAGKGDITIDWTDMTKTALGGDFDPTSITNVMVGHYTQSASDLEKKFLDLQLIATELYEIVVNTGTTMKLSDLKTSGGAQFQGIDSTGTWVLALQCGACHNPAPWYLTILRTCQ